MTTQNTIQVIDTAKVQVLTLGTLQTEQLNKDPWSLIGNHSSKQHIKFCKSMIQGSTSPPTPRDCLQNRMFVTLLCNE